MNAENLCMGCMEDRAGSDVCMRCNWREGSPADSPLYLGARTVLKEQYLVGRVLGHGGFGITYLGWDLNLDRKIAIKEYMPNGVASRASGDTNVTVFGGQARQDFEWGLEKFLDEGRVLARFQNHPCIVSVLNFFRQCGTAYLVMEFLDGASFDSYLTRKGGKISFEKTLRIMMPVMDALREVHKTGILHRDISPDNVYILRSGQVKVIDFGAARYALSQQSKALSIILKEGYAPEEQYRSRGNQGPWTDVYACAATMYKAVTGEAPTPALDRVKTDDLKRPSELGIAVDPAAEEALMKALAVDATNRFQSMHEFQAALGGGDAGFVPPPEPDPLPVPPVPPPPPQVASQSMPPWMLKAAAAAFGLLLVVWAGKRAFGPDEPQQQQQQHKQQQQKQQQQQQQQRQQQLQEQQQGYGGLMAQSQQAFRSRQYQSAGSLAQQAARLEPGRPEAHDMLGFLNLYHTGDITQAQEHLRTAVRLGGRATFLVRHDHANLSFADSCSGLLTITRAGVSFASNRGDSFQVRMAEVREAKNNKGLPFGLNAAPQERYTFHIKTNYKNYNMAGASRFRKEEANLIVDLIGRD
ncbi:MAG: protein kinase domain-containing protein [Bryobacteraceae bacterium]